MKHLILILLLLRISTMVSAQFVQGVISNQAGDPIPYATILSDSIQGQACNADGEFTLNSTDFPLHLTIRALDYNTKHILAYSAENISHITLTKKNIALSMVNIEGKKKAQPQTIDYKISKREIEKQSPSFLSEVLSLKPGIDQRAGRNTPLAIRGLSGRRMLVLRNGNRRFSSYPSGFMSHTINVYDLDRIEIEKGATSVTNGNGAIAGVINLIDKSPFKTDGFNARITGGITSNNTEKTGIACIGWSKDKLALKGGFRIRSADNFYYPDGSEAKNSFYGEKDLFTTLGCRISEEQALVLSADIHRGDPWGKPIGFNGSDYIVVGANFEDNTNIALKYTLGNADKDQTFHKLTASIYYGNESRDIEKQYYTAANNMLSFREVSYFDDYSFGGKVEFETNPQKTLALRTGIEGYYFKISTPIECFDYLYMLDYQYRGSVNANSENIGSYAEGTYAISKTMYLRAGIRLDGNRVNEGDYYSVDQSMEGVSELLVPSMNVLVRKSIASSIVLQLNIARTFRMPDVTELYTDSYSSNGITYGNPDLDPELSNSFDALLSYTKPWIRFEATPFLWMIHDMISKEEYKGIPGTNFQYTNIGKARLWGGELNLELPIQSLLTPNDRLALRSGLAYVNGTDCTKEGSFFDEGEPLDYIPPINLKSELNYQLTLKNRDRYDLGLYSTWYTEQTRLAPGGYATPAYHKLNLTAGYKHQFKDFKLSSRFTIENLTNKTYYPYYAYLPAQGRTFKLFITLSI